jgi:hypothetical protein|tara:strand:- start:207 stop:359 length:153 start_codon:yes stop_codon:yes gene_type:complete
LNSDEAVLLPVQGVEVAFRFDDHLGAMDLEVKVPINIVEVFALLTGDKNG